MSALSVDLGTSNTVAVLSAHGRPPRVVEVDGAANMPSALFAADDGRLVVGREAERQARLNPARFEPNPKRRVDEGTLLLGDRVVPVTEAFAAVLAKVAGEVSRQLGGSMPDEVRLTHPAQWGPVRRNVLLSAARQARLGTNLVLIPEPVAAAAHFASFPGRSLVPGQALVVYDLGAGTFDVAAVGATQNGFVVLAEAGLPDLGGLDVDQALLAHIGRQVSSRDPEGWQRLMVPQSTADRRSQRALREDVRAAKEALSGHPQTEVPLPEQFGDVLVTRAELEDLIRPNLLRSAQLLADTVRSAGLTPDRLAGIYLVGGSSRIPLVAGLIAEQLRIVPTNLDQPETAVALGALHVPREGTSLRTEQFSDERTTHIAPPPRPAAVSRSQVVPASRLQGHPAPVRQAPPFVAVQPGTYSPAPRVKPARRWLIPVLVAVVVAVMGGVYLWQLNQRGAEEDALANPKAFPTDMSCENVIPLDQVSDLFGTEAKDDRYAVKSGDSATSTARCAWSAVDSRNDRTSAMLSVGEWYGASSKQGFDSFVFNGNDATRQKINDACFIEVAIQVDKALKIDARSQAHGSCDLADSLLRIAFDKLPDA